MGMKYMVLAAALGMAACDGRALQAGQPAAEQQPPVDDQQAPPDAGLVPCVAAEVDVANGWHATAQSNGSWDWNCDAVEERKLTIDLKCGAVGDGAMQECR